ncbi:subtilisin-like protease SBT1.7 [Tripterygium wilfordii]|uniref:Subtilisin-like protease SBT1.7 n=1 Tax=Tripterygium wilfordii TaxID=458696 RepID=A0A7J7D2L9_TRIWF|nr:subtilisin-like protease SBT1.7 [Tripterygium wilfordii]
MELGRYQLAMDYALHSSTSMVATYVAGVASLLKVVHPEWSMTVIWSTLVTIAYTIDNDGSIITSQSTLESRDILDTPLDFGAALYTLTRPWNQD